MQKSLIEYEDTWKARFVASDDGEGALMEQQEAEFRAFYETHKADLEGRAVTALYDLSLSIGWFTAGDIADDPFEYQETTVYDAEHKHFEIGYTLNGRTDPWLDGYGWWAAAFQGTFLVGVRRKQC